jgi:hypothetical protein
MKPGVRPQIVDVPVMSCGQLLMVGEPGTQATRPQSAPQVNVVSALKLHRSQMSDLKTGIARTRKDQRIGSGLRLNDHTHQCPVLAREHLVPDFGKIHRKEHQQPMAHWKVIALVSGNIEVVSGPAAQDRPGAHEWIVREGQAADKAEALKSAEKADPWVDLE